MDNGTLIDVNNIAMYVTNSGGFANAREIAGSPSGLFFPRGTDKTVVYAAGLWVGGKVNGDVRVTVAEYDLEFQPGRIYADGRWANPADSRLRVYKMNKGESHDGYWPSTDGAPIDSAGRPAVIGDQMLWAVYNDANPATHTNRAGRSLPLNIEVQQTTFGFDRPPPLGNMVFIKFTVINRGRDSIQDCVVSLWADPDLGGFTDDLVGCDTLLSLGYCYNDTNNDEIYKGAPPAVGFALLQGPIVPCPGATAHVSGVPIADHRNLPMTSFSKYVNGTDPQDRYESYQYMLGRNRDAAPLVNPITGRRTNYHVSGDPVSGVGWIDDTPADRRLMLSAGPFTMAPRDSQEIVIGIIVAQGSDRLSSVNLLRSYAEQAKEVFDVNFELPSAPPRPELWVRPLDGSLELMWSTDALGDIQRSEELQEEYHHQGYNLYQGASIAGPWKKIATWDVQDSIGLIYNNVLDVDRGGPERIIIQQGSNSGLAHRVLITQDMIMGGSLKNFKEYYYAITAYSSELYHMERVYVGQSHVGHLTQSLENSQRGVLAVPKSSAAVMAADVWRIGGASDGAVRVEILDPRIVASAEYDVTFRKVSVVADGVGVERVVWDLFQTGTSDTLLKGREMQSSNQDEYAYPIINGMMVRVLGPEPGFKRSESDPALPMIEEVIQDETGSGWAKPGNGLWWAQNVTGEWGLSAGGGGGGEDRLTRDGESSRNLTSADIVMRWDYAEDNMGWWDFDDGTWGRVPFGLYLRDPATESETRLVPILYSSGGSVGVYDFDDGVVDGHFGLPCTDWVYAYTFDGDWEALIVDVRSDGVLDNDTTDLELFARLVVVSHTTELHVLPSEGTTILFSTTKPNTPHDHFRMRTYAPGERPGTIVGNDLSRVRAVPNPYRTQSQYEQSQFNRVIKFINLPSAETAIRIFNLGGELVRTIVKDDAVSSVAVWNLENEERIPVASGIYIYQIDAKGIGTEVGKMVVFVEKERLNRF